ncbi:MAG: gliding motility-associated C-terminal domain-containing protein, partial [Spirosomataceae bacterium]
NVNPGGVVIVSDAMSPNGDLINDELIITGITESDELRVRIYTRWGQLVYESDNYRRDFPDPNTGWNGVANRGLFFSMGGVPDGTYYYSIESPIQSVLNGETRFNFITIAR